MTTGCGEETVLPTEQIAETEAETSMRSTCNGHCDSECFLFDYCCCEFTITFQGDPEDIIFCKAWDALIPNCFIDSLTNVPSPCSYHWRGTDEDQLFSGVNPVCVVPGLDFRVENSSGNDTLTIRISCAIGCVDAALYTINPGQDFYFAVDSLCNHSFCGVM